MEVDVQSVGSPKTFCEAFKLREFPNIQSAKGSGALNAVGKRSDVSLLVEGLGSTGNSDKNILENEINVSRGRLFSV